MKTKTQNLFLSYPELETLTGYTRPSAQIRWLTANGWKFCVSAIGRPVVTRAETDNRLTRSKPKKAATRPDFGQISAAPDA